MENLSLNLERQLAKYSRAICLGLALAIAVVLTVHIARDSVIPDLDGQGYAMRAFALYGDLHMGQWHAFWILLESPNQSIIAPHYLPFFLLPGSLAGTTSYAALQLLVTYLVLAYAVGEVAAVLDRPAWAPVVFVLVSVNNVALNDFYDFYLDLMFCAFGLLAIALQMRAWRENRARTSMLSGAALGLLFFLKPANAVLFLGTYGFSELFYWAAIARASGSSAGLRTALAIFLRQAAGKCVGFIPIISIALVCGGVQTVLQLIERNEVQADFPPVEVGGLLRLLYFPLCLGVFYHVILLGGLVLAAMAYGHWKSREESPESRPTFPLQLLLPVVLSYLVLGEFFSFWILTKQVRALLLMLPVFGFAGCWWWEKERLRLAPLVAAVALYACAAYAQKAFDVFGTRDRSLEDTYQLTSASFVEMPSPWHIGSGLNLTICDFIRHDVPPSGVVCVNALELRGELNWRLNNQPMLLGQGPPYEVRSFFNFRGEYYAKALVGASAISLITFRPVQASRAVWLRSRGILTYGTDEWVGRGLARLSEMPSIRGEPIGYDFVFDPPLTQALIDHANASPAFGGIPKTATLPADNFYGRHYSRAEAWLLLQQWAGKRF